MKTHLILGLAALFLLITACSSAAPTNPPVKPTDVPAATSATTLDGKTLVQERCVGCHNLNRITSATGTADEWKIVVEQMVGRGAKLNAQEQQIVIDYLAATYSQ